MEKDVGIFREWRCFNISNPGYDRSGLTYCWRIRRENADAFSASQLGRSVYKIQMNTSNSVIPWTCHVCGKEFKFSNGGLCTKCNQTLCLTCSNMKTGLRHIKNEGSESLICKICSTERTDTPRDNYE